MQFQKYQHIERFGTAEVEEIGIGECYVFPKIDGTNASVWIDDSGNVAAGSRNRQLSAESDNAGFYAWASQDSRIADYLAKNPTHRLFGEWLVPHSLKTYRDDAWRRFYVFDVCVDADGGMEYLPYNVYKPLVEAAGLDFIPPLAIARNVTIDALLDLLDKNGFLIKDGAGAGEGVVIKNYAYKNKYGRMTWAKVVTNEFKAKHHATMGAPVVDTAKSVEERIVDDFVTPSFIEKEHAKIVTEKAGWSSKHIPMLLGRIFCELVKEETWNILKKLNNPTINYKALNALTIRKVKEVMPELF